MAERLGKDAKLYRLVDSEDAADLLEETVAGDATTEVAAAAAAGYLIEIDEVRNVSMDGPKSEADVTTRASGGWKQTAGTLIDLTLTFDLLVKVAGSTAYDLIRAAWAANTPIALIALDMEHDTAKAEGPSANWVITGFSRTEELEGVVTYSVTAKPNSCAHWYVSAGAAE